jgi:Guanylate-binding protein, N-terminal domain
MLRSAVPVHLLLHTAALQGNHPASVIPIPCQQFDLQVMLDTEGIDAWDQTGQYSVQIFSLAVLLSSLFVYNQMGGIDEAALDRLSLVTEMTKHIKVRAASGGAPCFA